VLAEVNEINYSNEDVQIYSQTCNIHSETEAKASTAESLDITPEDLAISDNVKVEWVLVASLQINNKLSFSLLYFYSSFLG